MKVEICERGLDLNTVYFCEQVILNKVSWKINLNTPEEIILLIFKPNSNDSNMTNILEHANLWIGFCMDEFIVYSKYDQFVITVACIVLTYEQMELEIKNIGLCLNAEEIEEVKNCVESIKQAYIYSDNTEVELESKETNVALEESDTCDLTDMNSFEHIISSSQLAELNHCNKFVINEKNESFLYINKKKSICISKRIKLRKAKRSLKIGF